MVNLFSGATSELAVKFYENQFPKETSILSKEF